jgi:hypothetical protein
MGELIDSPLVNHKLAELYRSVERLKGKSGKVPNPFSGIMTATDDPATKARTIEDVDGKLRFLLLPKVHVEEENGVIKSIRISVDAQNEKDIDEILRKKMARHGGSVTMTTSAERTRETLDGQFSGTWRIDTRNFKIGLLKIAYEFAVDSIPGFYSIVDAAEIARVLHTADFDSVEKFVKIGTGFQPTVFEPFAAYLDENAKKHYLVLIQTSFGLVCCVKLHSLFCIGIVLTQARVLNSSDAIFGINDIVQKTFRKLSLSEVIKECTGPVHTRIGYFFETPDEAALASTEINAPNYRYQEDTSGDIQFFDAQGNAVQRPLDEILRAAACTDRHQDGWITSTYEFGVSEDLYVRSLLSDRLYRVSALEVSREFLKKV